LILTASGTAIGIQYIWQTLIMPAFFPGSAPVDFVEDYVGSAQLMVDYPIARVSTHRGTSTQPATQPRILATARVK
jgi:hypothetical protein